jgi:hypothetical protein
VEGNSGTTQLAFTVSLSAPAADAVTVNYATGGGTATAGSDYVAQSGTLTFAPGETVRTILVDVIGDATFESDETFAVTLSAPSVNARVQTSSATGTITNDDVQPPSVTPTLAIGSVSALESAGWLRFTVTLSRALSTKVTVRFATANGTAVAGRTGDYTSTSGTLTFNPGETSKVVSIAVRNDSAIEADETFFVNLSRASGATISTSRGTGTILNDDVAAATASRLPLAAAFAAFQNSRPSAKPARR